MRRDSRSSMLRNPLRWLFSRQPVSRNRRRPAPFRPFLEAFEDRAVPSVYHVTTNADSGAGSLRDAVDAANKHVGADTIVFDTSLAGKTIMLTSGELVVTDDLSIDGLGAAKLRISGAASSRVFEIQAGATTIAGLTISGGNALADNSNGTSAFDGVGGSILNLSTLKLRNCALSDSTADGGGGGIFNFFATLTVSDSGLSSNSAFGAGGVLNFGGALTINGSSFSNNHAIGGTDGGAIINSLGTVIVSGSTFSGNSADVLGGAFVNNDSMTITGSVLAGNSALGGGGLYNEGNLTVRSSIFSGNSANTGGGLLNSFGTANISDSILAGNSAIDYTAFGTVFHGAGGAISNDTSGTVTITNCILAGNSATGNGGGVNNVFGGSMIMTGCALFGNSANGDGGGIFNAATLTVIGCILAGNSASSDGGGIFNNGGTVNLGFSLLCMNTPDNIVGGFTDLGGNVLC